MTKLGMHITKIILIGPCAWHQNGWNNEFYAVSQQSGTCGSSSKTQYQKHYANDADELERYGFFKKSKARVTQHNDQSKVIFLPSVGTEMLTIVACTRVDRTERASMVSIQTVAIVFPDSRRRRSTEWHHKCKECLVQFKGEWVDRLWQSVSLCPGTVGKKRQCVEWIEAVGNSWARWVQRPLVRTMIWCGSDANRHEGITHWRHRELKLLCCGVFHCVSHCFQSFIQTVHLLYDSSYRASDPFSRPIEKWVPTTSGHRVVIRALRSRATARTPWRVLLEEMIILSGKKQNSALLWNIDEKTLTWRSQHHFLITFA